MVFHYKLLLLHFVPWNFIYYFWLFNTDCYEINP